MKEIHIINPQAGSKKKKNRHFSEVEIYETKEHGDLERYVSEVCKTDPDVHFTVYGGDGTVCEAVNGIMKAGEEASRRAVLSVVPSGTGNDFVRNFKDADGSVRRIDVIKVNDVYCANMINIGFDCDVVAETDKIKKFPLTSGSFGYVVGVLKMLLKKLGTRLVINFMSDKGDAIEEDRSYLLSSVSNGGYCGGGFHSSPPAKLDDGLMDIMIVDNLKKSTFLKLVGAYRKGSHVDPETCEVKGGFKKILRYYRTDRAIFEGLTRICIDGEIIYTDRAEMTVVPSSLNVQMPAKSVYDE